jgi:hypothetical protein
MKLSRQGDVKRRYENHPATYIYAGTPASYRPPKLVLTEKEEG